MVKETIELQPYPGSEIRGCLGWALRSVSYGKSSHCPTCRNRPDCRYGNIYSYLFESPKDHPFIVHNVRLQKYKQQNYPQPMVIYPPVGGVHLQGDIVTVGITLIGYAINFLQFLCCGLRLMKMRKISGGANKIELRGIRDRLADIAPGDSGKSDQPASEGWKPTVLDLTHFLRQAQRHKNLKSIKIIFLTPFRFRHRNKLGKELNFYVFFKNILRRITLLSVHSPLDTDINYSDLLEKARFVDVVSTNMMEWYDWERYSSKQRKKMRLGGLVGEIKFSGDLGTFIPYIKLGEFLHVGKGGSFGLGKYSIIECG